MPLADMIPKKTEQWFKALLAAFIGGVSNAFLNAIGATTISSLKISDIQQFTLKQLVMMSLIGGIVGAMMYLKQSPVPPDSTGDTSLVKREPNTTDKKQ